MADVARTYLFAGGGSGGHISPGLAIAERVVELEPGARCLFACSRRPVDAHMLSQAGQRYFPLDAAPLSSKLAGLIRFAIGSFKAVRQANELIRSERVDHVLLLGGFVAAPVAYAASRLKVRCTLINLDLPPGKANRWIAKRATDIISAIPFPTPQPPLAASQSSSQNNHSISNLPPPFNARIVSTPVRRRALATLSPQESRKKLELDPDKKTLFITGASQGSTSINELLIAFVSKHAGALANWQILHLAGRDDCKPIEDAYKKQNIAARVIPFLDDMGFGWGAADLSITRAGANSVAEVAANAVPAIFLPYPWHADRHQWQNAQPLADLGGAMIFDDQINAESNLATIGPALAEFLINDARRAAMRAALQNNRPPDGAAAIAEMLVKRQS